MAEAAGALVLLAGVGGLLTAAALGASCLRLRSPLEFLLAVYVLAWAWLVALTFALSPLRLVDREWLALGIGVGLAAALAAWDRMGRPELPAFRPSLSAARAALGRPVLLVLATAVLLGVVYTVALALFTPVNEGDSLSYHLARAAFWKQEHGLGYVLNAIDVRLNSNPPNAEIGQLATMLLSGSDRFVALPQLGAYAALTLCVAALARRIGLGVPEAMFGALVFATLPVVAVQASGALNDLVVGSFLAIAALFALRPGRASLVLVALALGLALGTKFTAVLALPTLVLVALVGRPRRAWPGLALAGAGGVALGSVWYLVNLVETRDLDGGLAAMHDQRIDLSVAAVVVNALRFGLDLVDMSGAGAPHTRLLLVAGLVLAVLALTGERESRRQLSYLGACLLTLVPLLAPTLVGAGQDFTVRAWDALGRPETPPFERGWDLNLLADPTSSWFGPLGALLLAVGTVAVVVVWRRGQLPAASLALAASPWVLLLMLAAAIAWDPWRGRFLVPALALAAATWGVLLRWPIVSRAAAGMGTVMLALALANYFGKPSGLGELWPPRDTLVSVETVWGAERADVQTRLRPAEGEEIVFDFVEREVPRDARMAVAVRGNDFVFPYFGARLSRHVELVPDGDAVPADAEWLVVAPSSAPRACGAAWERELRLGSGWRVERRVGPDTCA